MRHFSGISLYKRGVSIPAVPELSTAFRLTSSAVSTPHARFMQNPFSYQKGHSRYRSTL